MPHGIELKSEQKLDEMVQIMASLHKYVPIDTATQVVTLPDGTAEVTHGDFSRYVPVGTLHSMIMFVCSSSLHACI